MNSNAIYKPLYNIYYEAPDGARHYFWQKRASALSHTNFGMPSFRMLEDNGPNQHGVTVRGYRADTRTITIEWFGENCDRDCVMSDIIDKLRPNRSFDGSKHGWLRVVTPRQQRQMEIPARVIRGPNDDYNYRGPIKKNQAIDTVQFYCEDPFWRCTRQAVHDLSGFITVDDACLPACIPACLDDSALVADIDIRYCGTWAADQVDIEFYGPLTNPRVANNTTGQQIVMNYTIPAGDVVYISIRPETFSVVDQSGNNLAGTITNLSDAVFWRLAPAGDLTPDGTNALFFSGSGGLAGVSNIVLKYYTRFISVYDESCDGDCVDQCTQHAS